MTTSKPKLTSITGAERSISEFLSRNRIRLASWPTPVSELQRLRKSLGSNAELLVKREDLVSFGFGGSKVRKLEILVAEARAARANVLVAAGGLQSNCTRTTAEVAAALQMDCVIVANGCKPERATGNLLLCQILGARIEYALSREDRPRVVASVLDELRARGKRPFEVPVSAATPKTALAMTAAMLEFLDERPAPDIIFVCSSSGATQAGLLLATAVRGAPTRVIGISPDDPTPQVAARIESLIEAMVDLLSLGQHALPDIRIEVDDSFVCNSPLGRTRVCDHAMELLARTEGLFVDPIYTSRPAAALVDAIQHNRFPDAKSILLWHTGGLPGLFS